MISRLSFFSLSIHCISDLVPTTIICLTDALKAQPAGILLQEEGFALTFIVVFAFILSLLSVSYWNGSCVA